MSVLPAKAPADATDTMVPCSTGELATTTYPKHSQQTAVTMAYERTNVVAEAKQRRTENRSAMAAVNTYEIAVVVVVDDPVLQVFVQCSSSSSITSIPAQ
jgi:hypothetical protein